VPGGPLPPKILPGPPVTPQKNFRPLSESPTQIIDSSLVGKLAPPVAPPNENVWLRPWKGVFPYDWFNSLEKFNETQLPSKEFYSKLSDSDITDDDFVHVQKVWEHFGMKTFREYHDLYLKTDVLLLADVFEIFRNICLNNCSRTIILFTTCKKNLKSQQQILKGKLEAN